MDMQTYTKKNSHAKKGGGRIQKNTKKYNNKTKTSIKNTQTQK